MTLDVESDLHCALMDVGVLYASALTHAGWDALQRRRGAAIRPSRPTSIPVIECRKGDDDGGHAFAIVGYTDKGFIVHNSWGTRWGRGGFAILTYSDWRQNAMDCWVAQLGVVTLEHQRVAQASSLRLEGEDETKPPRRISGVARGRAVERSRAGQPRDLAVRRRHAERRTTERSRTVQDQRGRPDIPARAPSAEGGLRALGHRRDRHHRRRDLRARGAGRRRRGRRVRARQWIPLLYGNRIFPIFLMWETDGLSTRLQPRRRCDQGRRRARVGANWLERFREPVHRLEGRAHRRADARARWRAVAADEGQRQRHLEHAPVGRGAVVPGVHVACRKQGVSEDAPASHRPFRGRHRAVATWRRERSTRASKWRR